MNITKQLIRQIEGKSSIFESDGEILYAKYDKISIEFGHNEFIIIFEWKGEVINKKSIMIQTPINEGDVIALEGITGRQEFSFDVQP